MNLHLLPIHRQASRDLQDLPGLFVADSGLTRKAARSRKGDRLVLYLALEGTATVAPEGLTEVLESLARDYFESGGSVTTGLRALAESLNEFLLGRNREGASRSLQATGLLAGFALHAGQIYTLQSGPTHIFTVHAVTAQAFHDPLLAGGGLGLGRTAPVYLNHAPIAVGDLIILAVKPPSAWKAEALQKAYGRSISTIHRVLMNAAGPDVRAVLIQAHDGRGDLKVLKTEHLEALPPPVEPVLQPAPEAAADAPPAGPAPVKAAGADRIEPITSLSTPVRTAPRTAPPSELGQDGAGRTAGKAGLAVLRAFWGTMKTLGFSLRSALSRVLPGSDLFTIPASTMAFIAVAIPVLVVAVAGFVYVQRGRLGQYDTYMAKAEEVAAFAAGRSDPNEARISWLAVVDYVNLAEAYQVTAESQELRSQAFAALDPLDGIERLDFQPALLTPMGESVNIVRLIATRDEIFMLDATSGSVIRAWLSGRGFEIDTDFKCGSFGNNTYSIGRLIDLAPLPQTNALGADVFAMDADGNALYCTADGSPPIAQAVAPPSSNWGDPRAFVLDSGALYILDPQTNAVWIYGGENYIYINPPRLFFDEDVPQMAGVVDFAVDLSDLYLLFDDGHLVTCVFGFAGQSTRCNDPAPYTETRPGRESGTIVPDASFSQIRFSPPPDPSIYLLDPPGEAIYHYSLRLTFQRQFRPLEPVGEAATAFAISPGRMVFLAYGNEVFWALMP